MSEGSEITPAKNLWSGYEMDTVCRPSYPGYLIPKPLKPVKVHHYSLILGVNVYVG